MDSMNIWAAYCCIGIALARGLRYLATGIVAGDLWLLAAGCTYVALGFVAVRQLRRAERRKAAV